MGSWTKLKLPAALGMTLVLANGQAAASAEGQPPARTFCALKSVGITPLAGRARHSVKEFGAVGDGISDDTAALQAALNGVPAGAILDFPAGTYAYSRVLTLARSDVVLRGVNATLKARTPGHQALMVTGDRSAVVGLALQGAARERLHSLESAQLVIRGRSNQVVGNTVSGGASAGIFALGARDFRISGNRVFATRADGIHITEGSRDGVVEGNVVHETGDDLIAVVSYRPRPDQRGISTLSRSILIQDNTVWGNSWGRGITVVGGEDVTIIGNSIRKVPAAAGIYVSQEQAYRTHGVRHVTVANNYVGDIQTRLSPSGAPHPQHGAIDLNSSNEAPHEFIDVENNVVEGAGFAGIRLLGEVCHVRLTGNTLKSVRRNRPGKAIDIIQNAYHGKCGGQSVQCVGNTVDGTVLADDRRCTAATPADWRKPAPQAPATARQGAIWASCTQP